MIADEVQELGQSLGITFPPVGHVFDARGFRPPYAPDDTRPSSRTSLGRHSGWHPSHVRTMLEDYPVALDAFGESLSALWADLHSGPVTIVAYCLAGEMRSVCMTRVLAYYLSAFPCRVAMNLQVYHLSALQGRWRASHHVQCRDARAAGESSVGRDARAASESSLGMCSECRGPLGDNLTLQLFRQLGMPTLGS